MAWDGGRRADPLLRILVLVVGGGLGSLVGAWLAIAAAGLVEVAVDLPPAGDACAIDEGSGASTAGVEEVRWWPVPGRDCRPIGPPAADGAPDGAMVRAVLGLVAAAMAVAGWLAGAWAGIQLTDRRVFPAYIPPGHRVAEPTTSV